MKISGIILDLDGVLINTETISKRAWIQAAEEFGFTFSESLYSRVAGRSIRSARVEIESETQGLIDIDRYMALSTNIYNDEMNQNGIEIMDGVTNLLDFLDETGLKSAIATSTSQIQAERKLKNSGMHGKINTVVTADEIKNGKPAPDLFLLAAERIAITPKECVVIEDAEAGIIGASSAEMIPIMVPSTIAPSAITKELSYAIVPTLNHTLDVIRRLVNHT